MDEQAQQQQNAEFLSGYAGGESPEKNPAPAADKAAEAVDKQPSGEAANDADQGDKSDGSAAVGEGDDAADLVAGFTQSELRNLLERAAKADSMEKEVRKLHGKFGELNGLYQDLRSKVQQAPAKTPELSPEIAQIEKDYPEIAAYVQALVPKKDVVEPVAQQKPAQEAQASEGIDQVVQLAILDQLHKGWREKVNGGDFQLWLASQPGDARSAFESAATAADVIDTLGKFDSWKSGRDARKTDSKKRLEQALTPAGRDGKPKTAPSERDAFLAGFHGKE